MNSMERKRATDFPQELWYLVEDYNHGFISRRDFFERAGKFAVGGLTIAGLLEAMSYNFALGQQIPQDDARIKSEYATVPSAKGNGSIRGYLARPAKAASKLPGVIVVHGESGLNPHIEDVARRLATQNFMAFAPDGLTSQGGNEGGDVPSGEAKMAKVDKEKLSEDFIAATSWLKSRSDCTGKVGIVGFCMGGGVANRLAVRMPDLAAAVPYYGEPPTAPEVAKIKAAVLVHHAGLDKRLLAGWPAYEAALKQSNVKYEGYVYPNVNHAFFNDSGARYDDVAAKLSWERTLTFLRKYLVS
jgi:carboxymethylenebutenolidase